MPKVAVQNPVSVLKSLMDEYQLNPNKIATDIGLSQSAVRLVVIGRARISIPVALRFAKYFGTTPEYWIALQNKADLNEAAKDVKLKGILKGIAKVKKSAPPKKAAKTAASKKAGKSPAKARGRKKSSKSPVRAARKPRAKKSVR
jgi:addiction module HigA family antidote